MPALPWRSYYKLGVEKIDEQHQTLVKLINEIFKRTDEGNITLVQEELMPEFTRYLNFHNLYEESLMKDYLYPGTQQHITGHKHMVARCESMLDKFTDEKNNIEDVEDEFLRSVIQHLTGDDFELASYIKRMDKRRVANVIEA